MTNLYLSSVIKDKVLISYPIDHSLLPDQVLILRSHQPPGTCVISGQLSNTSNIKTIISLPKETAQIPVPTTLCEPCETCGQFQQLCFWPEVVAATSCLDQWLQIGPGVLITNNFFFERSEL